MESIPDTPKSGIPKMASVQKSALLRLSPFCLRALENHQFWVIWGPILGHFWTPFLDPFLDPYLGVSRWGSRVPVLGGGNDPF